MASNNSSVVQSFSIALIVFVMLTFVLAVTTYLFYKKADEAQKVADTKQKEASDANTKRLEAEKNRLELVKDVLGFQEDMANPQILERKRDAIDDVYGKYLKEKEKEPTYQAAVEELSKSIEEHYRKMDGLQAEKDRFAAEKKELADKQVAELDKLTASRKAAQDEVDKLRKEKSQFEKESTEQKNRLVAEKSAVEDQVKRFKQLGEEIAKARQYLSTDRQQKWPSDSEPAGGDRDDRRVALVLDELRERERTIFRLNQIIAKLRVADPALQAAVLSSTPKDDRVDGFDGRILSVNELDRTVLVACGRTTGLRAGLKFDVFEPTDPRPQLGSRKAVVEVVAIESDSLVRCRVRQDSTRDPIIPGDVVATSLWSPDTPLEVVVVGLVQLGGDAESDRKRLEQLVERIGGSVEDSVTPSTTIVVDAGPPKVKGVDAEGQVASRKVWTAKQKEKRINQLDVAKQLGIKVMAIEPFLGLLGLQVESVRENRLPTPAVPYVAPARADMLSP